MFFLHYEVTPRRDHPDDKEIAGAFVNCWINRPSIEQARGVAEEWLIKLQYVFDEPEEVHEVRPSDYAPGSPQRDYCDRAMIDGEVFAIHTWPVDESE